MLLDMRTRRKRATPRSWVKSVASEPSDLDAPRAFNADIQATCMSLRAIPERLTQHARSSIREPSWLFSQPTNSKHPHVNQHRPPQQAPFSQQGESTLRRRVGVTLINMLRCPVEGCGRLFRSRGNRSQHLQHYHAADADATNHRPRQHEAASARPPSISTTGRHLEPAPSDNRRLVNPVHVSDAAQRPRQPTSDIMQHTSEQSDADEQQPGVIAVAQSCAARSTRAEGDVDGLFEAVAHPNKAVSSDSDYLSDADCGECGVPDNGPAARFGSFLSGLREAPDSICEDGAVSDGLCADVLEHYNGYGDADAATSLYAEEGSLPDESPFDQAGLQQLFYFVCSAGGVGLSRKDTKSFYDATVAYERTNGVRNSPLRGRFPSASAFWRAVRQQKRRILFKLGWRSAMLEMDGSKYQVLFRDGLEMALRSIRDAAVVRWSKQEVWTEDDPAGRRERDPLLRHGKLDPAFTGCMDARAFQANAAHVAARLPAGTKVIGIHAYSDGTVVTSTGGMLLSYLWVLSCGLKLFLFQSFLTSNFLF